MVDVTASGGQGFAGFVKQFWVLGAALAVFGLSIKIALGALGLASSTISSFATGALAGGAGGSPSPSSAAQKAHGVATAYNLRSSRAASAPRAWAAVPGAARARASSTPRSRRKDSAAPSPRAARPAPQPQPERRPPRADPAPRREPPRRRVAPPLRSRERAPGAPAPPPARLSAPPRRRRPGQPGSTTRPPRFAPPLPTSRARPRPALPPLPLRASRLAARRLRAQNRVRRRRRPALRSRRLRSRGRAAEGSPDGRPGAERGHARLPDARRADEADRPLDGAVGRAGAGRGDRLRLAAGLAAPVAPERLAGRDRGRRPADHRPAARAGRADGPAALPRRLALARPPDAAARGRPDRGRRSRRRRPGRARRGSAAASRSQRSCPGSTPPSENGR